VSAAAVVAVVLLLFFLIGVAVGFLVVVAVSARRAHKVVPRVQPVARPPGAWPDRPGPGPDEPSWWQARGD